MNLRELEIFRAVMTCGTTARAAELLEISQPAVSKAVQGLEKSVGFLLFSRTKGRLVPTPEAQLFLREVDRAFVGLTHLRSVASRIRDFGSGDVKIACLSALSLSLVPEALSRFHQRHPDVAITLQVRTSAVVRDLVASGRFDIGVAANEIDVAGVVARPFGMVRAQIAVYPGHSFERLERLSPADLHQQSLVALAPEDTARREAEAVFAAHDVTPRITAETPYSATVCALVLSGLGCGFVDPLTAPSFVERGLILKPFDPPVFFRTLLIFPPDRQPSRLVEALVGDLETQRDRTWASLDLAL